MRKGIAAKAMRRAANQPLTSGTNLDNKIGSISKVLRDVQPPVGESEAVDDN